MSGSDVLDALTDLAWPLLVAAIVWKLYPYIIKVIESRGFTVKVAGMEISVQEASENFRKQIEDLQNQVLTIQQQHGPAQGDVGLDAPVATLPEADAILAGRRIAPLEVLWVDDNPANNAFEIARLRDQGVGVIEALSTDEAISILASYAAGISVIITDMGRKEAGEFRPIAGIELIEKVRQAGIPTPIYVYTTRRNTLLHHDAVLQAGGNGVTASPLDLIRSIQDGLRQS